MDFFSFLLAFLIVGLSIYFIILHSSNHKDSSKSTKQNSASVKSQPLNSKNQQDLKANETSSKLFEDNTPQIISTPKEEEKINESKTESSSENIILKEIYFYPIKSCRGISVKKAKIDRFGIMYDRAWLIVDVNAENHGKFITQRTHPKLALIETKIEDETLFIKTPTQPELKVHSDLLLVF